MMRIRSSPPRKLHTLLGLCAAIGFTAFGFKATSEAASPGLDEWPSANAVFSLSTTIAQPGETVSITMSIEARQPIEGFSFALIYRATNVDLLSVTPIVEGGGSWDVFEKFVLDRDNTIAWRDDIWGRAVFNPVGSGTALTAMTRHAVLRIDLRVHEDAPSGLIPIFPSNTYMDPEDPGTVDWENAVFTSTGPVRAFFSDWRVHGGIMINPPTGVPFVRGDVNADGTLSVSDALMLRRYMSPEENQGEIVLSCLDAGDVNDDGCIDITDAVVLLLDIYRLDQSPGHAHLAPPFPEPGIDPTFTDEMGCQSYVVELATVTDDILRIGDIEAAPGEEVEIPVYLTNAVSVEAVQLNLLYDPGVIVPRQGYKALAFRGTPWEAAFDELPNPECLDSEGEETEDYWVRILKAHSEDGVMAVCVSSHLVYDCYPIPPGGEKLIFTIRATVAADAPVGSEIVLEPTNGPDGGGLFPPFNLRNELTHQGEGRFLRIVPRTEPGHLGIIADITFFFRGDSNSDLTVDIADAVHTLNHLFLGGATLRCPDSADADDNGVIEITDPILTLNHLFLGEAVLARPYPSRGHDFQLDELGPCSP